MDRVALIARRVSSFTKEVAAYWLSRPTSLSPDAISWALSGLRIMRGGQANDPAVSHPCWPISVTRHYRVAGIAFRSTEDAPSMKRGKAIIERYPHDRVADPRSTAQDLQGHWPAGGARLAPGIQPPGFLPVTEEILAEIIRRLVAALNPEKIILFGTYVYGSRSGDSDVDLLVIMQTTARPADRYVAVSRAIRPRPFPLDILVKTPDEIAGALAKGDSFIEEIVTRGRVLYARLD